MRIVINGWFLDQLNTGSGQYIAALAEWLPRVDAAPELIFVRPARQLVSRAANQPISGVDDAGQYTAHNIQHAVHTPFDRFSPNLAKLWFEQVAFPRACRHLHADVAFIPYWGAPWRSPCPVVVTVHDLIPLLLPAYRGGALQRAYTWLVTRTARWADAVLTDSEASKADIVTHLRIPSERVHAIHLAADPGYRPVTDPEALERVRTRYALPEGPFLLYLGGFDVRKNVLRTIEAYARLVKRRRAVDAVLPPLVIAGKLPKEDAPFAPDPRQLVHRLDIEGWVHFTDWIDEADKPALYTLAAAVVFASEYEGFGLPVLEAMACAAEQPYNHFGANS